MVGPIILTSGQGRVRIFMMNVLISVNKCYLDKAKTMLHSLRRNNSEDVTVYLINHSLNCAELKKFRNYLQKHLRMDLVVMDVSTTAFDQLPFSNRFSIEMYYRVIAQFLLPQTVDYGETGNVILKGTFTNVNGEKALAAVDDFVAGKL